ncbi:MAG: ribbon-helix-helix protein, CopG family [Candidatus Woesearchaeota archaeon]
MRHKISISIEQELILKINQARTENRRLRSRSHVIEEALRDYLEKKVN